MSAMVGLQMQPPSASDIAQTLTDALDTNGDGVVSQDEIQAALKAAGNNSDISKAFADIDTDGDGSLSKDELTAAVQKGMDAHRHHRAEKGAETLLSSFDSDGDKGLSLKEVANAIGSDPNDTSLGSAFASLDSDGDGNLSTDELSTAIQARMDAAIKAYASQAMAA